MITINFDAVVGVGIRQRVILPALILQEKPVIIVSPRREILEINWPKIADDRKMTLQRFLMAMPTRTVEPDALILIEEMRPEGWKRVDPWLKALDNEVWTINRALSHDHIHGR